MRKLVLFLVLLLVVVGVAEARFRNFPPHGGGAGPVAPPPAPTASLSALPTTIVSGDSSTLTWSSTDATSCVGLNADFNTGNATAGSTSVSPAITTVYNVSCSGLGGSASAAATITVTSPPVVTASLSANPTTIAAGGSSTLTWSSTNATSCTGTNFSTGNAISGTQSVSPVVTTSYSVLCTGASGSASANASVTVAGGGIATCADLATADGCALIAPTTNRIRDSSLRTYGFGATPLPPQTFGTDKWFTDTMFSAQMNGSGVAVGTVLVVKGGEIYMLQSPTQIFGGGLWKKITGGTEVSNQLAPGGPIMGTDPWLTVNASAAATTIGIPAAADSLYAASALTITVDSLPNNGTVTLSDGTPVAAGQTLTPAQLTGLKFVADAGKPYSRTSHFLYTIANPITVKAYGSASLTVRPNGLWADPLTVPTLAGAITAPNITQPSLSGDLVGVRFQDVSGSGFAGGYKTFSHVYQIGTVQPSDTITARISGTNRYVQSDIKTTYPDGSVRQAILTLNVPSISSSGTLDAMLAKCGGGFSACPSAPTAAPLRAGTIALLVGAADVTDAFTGVVNVDTSGSIANDTASAHDCLNATPIPQQWLAGAAVNEYEVVCTYLGGHLRVEFDIRAYSDNTIWVDVIHNNGWGTTGGKSNLQYNYAISKSGTTYYNESSIKQWLYTYVHREVPGSMTALASPNIQFDVQYWQEAGVFPRYDLSLGVDSTHRAGDIAQAQSGSCTPLTVQNPSGVCQMVAGQAVASGREDLAPSSNWFAKWMVSQDAGERLLAVNNANLIGTQTFYFMDDSTTNDVVNLQNNPTFSPANTIPCPASNNTINCAGNPWQLDDEHPPSSAFELYMTTGQHYWLTSQQGQGLGMQLWWGTNVFNGTSQAQVNGTLDALNYRRMGYGANFINVPACSANPCGGGSDFNFSNAKQGRATAWDNRDILRSALATPDASPNKSWFNSVSETAMKGLVQHWVADNYERGFGQLNGVNLMTSGASNPPNYAEWQENFLIMMAGIESEYNLGSGTSANAYAYLKYGPARAVSAQWLNGPTGLPPLTANWYNVTITEAPPSGCFITNSCVPISTFAELMTRNNSGGAACGGGTVGGLCANPTLLIGPTPQAVGGFSNINDAGMAYLQRASFDEGALQAWAFIRTFIMYEYNNGCGQSGVLPSPCYPLDYQYRPQFLFAPRLADGSQLWNNSSNLQLTSGAGAITLTCSTNPCVLGAVSTSSSGSVTMTGGSGVSVLTTMGNGNGIGSPSTMSAGSGDAHMYGGCGAGTYNAGSGNDVIAAGANCSGTPGASTVRIRTTTPGSKTKSVGYRALNGQLISGYRPGTDVPLNFAANLNGSGVTSGNVMSLCATSAAGDAVFTITGGLGSLAATVKGVTCAAMSGSVSVN